MDQDLQGTGLGSGADGVEGPEGRPAGRFALCHRRQRIVAVSKNDLSGNLGVSAFRVRAVVNPKEEQFFQQAAQAAVMDESSYRGSTLRASQRRRASDLGRFFPDLDEAAGALRSSVHHSGLRKPFLAFEHLQPVCLVIPIQHP